MQYKWGWIVPYMILIVALVPVVLPSDVAQVDEAVRWFDRAANFQEAIATGDFAATVQTEHPGVTTMALGTVGRLLLAQLDPQARLTPIQQLDTVRLPIKLVNAVVVLLAYRVMVRVFASRTIALIAALLWALSPFLRHYNRLLHIDGLSTGFMALSFLLLLLAYGYEVGQSPSGFTIRWRYLVGAAFVGGLAALSRFTSFFLVGMAGVLVLINLVVYRRELSRAVWGRAVGSVALFTVTVALTWTLLYPGMWTNLNGIIDQTLHGVDNALAPHSGGNYFLGQPVPAPAWYFYPVAAMLRITPFVLAGLVFAVIAAGVGPVRHRVHLALLLYAVLYTVAMTLQPKMFDRYILPIFPVLFMLAAAGWRWFLVDIQWPKQLSTGHHAGLVGAILLVAVFGHSLVYLNTGFAYANEVMGGGKVAERVLLVGNGEGLNDVAAFISSALDDPEACDLEIRSAYHDLLAWYLPCSEPGWFELKPENNYPVYYIWYISHRQRHPEEAAQIEQFKPVYTLTYQNMTVAQVYDGATVQQLFD